MSLINKKKFRIQFIILCLLIGSSACGDKKPTQDSTELPNISSESPNISNDASEKIKALQDGISNIRKLYFELEALQKKQQEDVTTQLKFILCSQIRLTRINPTELLNDSDKVKERLRDLKFLEITNEKNRKDFFQVRIINEYNYRNDYKHVMSGMKKHNNQCLEYYWRIIPKSQEAKTLETEMFEKEISRAIKRLKSLPARFGIIEQLSSEATTCQNFLQKRLDEYIVDRTDAIANDGLEKSKACTHKIIEGMKKVNEVEEDNPTTESKSVAKAEVKPEAKPEKNSFLDWLFE